MSNGNQKTEGSTGVAHQQDHPQKKYSHKKGMTQDESQHVVISPRQSSSLIASTVIGVGVLTLPRVTAEQAQEAAWISSITGSVAAIISIAIITQLGLRFPYKNIAQYSEDILGSDKSNFGRFLGKALSFPLIMCLFLLWLLSTASVARTFGEVVVTSVLRQTPLEVTIITMLITAFILVLYDVEVLARVNEILVPIIVFPVLFIALFSFQSFELENLLPLWPNISIVQFLFGALSTFFAYQGYEIISVFSAHTHVTKKSMKMNIIGILIPTTIYLLIVFAGISVFGKYELSFLMWPTLELVKVTQAPGLVLERMESAFLGVWVAAVFTTTANVFYAATLLISQYFNVKQYRRWIGLVLLPIIYWISLSPQDVLELFEWSTYIGYFGVIMGTSFPIMLAIIAKVRKKGAKPIPYQDDFQEKEGQDKADYQNINADKHDQNKQQKQDTKQTDSINQNSSEQDTAQRSTAKKQGEEDGQA